MMIKNLICHFIIICTYMFIRPVHATTFISGYTMGLELIGGNIANSTPIQYHISDAYNEQKNASYQFGGIIGLGFNLGLLHYNNLETEFFIDLYSGSTKNAPNYYDYIRYPMNISGIILPFGVREHYYLPIFNKTYLDFGVGLGGIYTYGSYTDKHNINDYHQVPWKETLLAYNYSIGFLWKKSEHFAVKIGYQRTQSVHNYIGKGLNKFYIGIKGLLSCTKKTSNK